MRREAFDAARDPAPLILHRFDVSDSLVTIEAEPATGGLCRVVWYPRPLWDSDCRYIVATGQTRDQGRREADALVEHLRALVPSCGCGAEAQSHLCTRCGLLISARLVGVRR